GQSRVAVEVGTTNRHDGAAPAHARDSEAVVGGGGGQTGAHGTVRTDGGGIGVVIEHVPARNQLRGQILMGALYARVHNRDGDGAAAGGDRPGVRGLYPREMRQLAKDVVKVVGVQRLGCEDAVELGELDVIHAAEGVRQSLLIRVWGQSHDVNADTIEHS